MAFQIKQVDVIDDSRNFINFAGANVGAAGTTTWNSGSNKINIGDNIIYGPGSPTATTPADAAGDIKIDGTITASGINVPLA